MKKCSKWHQLVLKGSFYIYLLIRSGMSSEASGILGFDERDWISLASSLQSRNLKPKKS